MGEFSSKKINEIGNLYEGIMNESAKPGDNTYKSFAQGVNQILKNPFAGKPLTTPKRGGPTAKVGPVEIGVTDPKTDVGARASRAVSGFLGSLKSKAQQIGAEAEKRINKAGGYTAPKKPVKPALAKPAPSANAPKPSTPRPASAGAAAPATTVSKPATARPAPAAAAAAQTGNRTKDLSTWAKSNEKMISKVGTPQQRAILSAAKSGSAMPAPKPISTDIGDIKGAIKRSQERQAAQSGPTYSSSDVKSKMSSRTKTMLGLKDSYDIVLDYLVSQGHVDTLEEALYVMIEMDAENIRSIVEGVMPEPIDPAAHKAAQKTQKIYNLGKGTNNPNEAQSALKRTGPQLPGV